ncbi:MAG: methyltransferase [Acidimicrobiales bacterium]
MGEPGGHYFDTAPTSPSKRGSVRLDLPDRSLTLTTDRGVFSADRIDAGTKYLLLEAPSPPGRGTFVDLGCGYGAIACTMAARAPAADVWGVDVNARAIDLCRLNAAELGLANLHVTSADDTPAELAVDLLWSNPPIRIGKPALHELLGTWLRRLTPDGAAVLVVQKHLGADSLQRWLGGAGWPTERLGSRAGYRLLQVRRP